MVQAQLHLLPVERPWRLDSATRRIGMAGVAQARAALLATGQRDTDEPTLSSRPSPTNIPSTVIPSSPAATVTPAAPGTLAA